MIRPILSYALTGVILLSQTGLPLHMHFCKGMLESVSVFINTGCDKHEEFAIADLPACCKKEATTNCKEKDNCCDDEVALLLQDFDSLMPHFDKWDQVLTFTYDANLTSITYIENHSTEFVSAKSCDSGPPFYILFHSLRLYA
jgi:hypothetical protein